MRLNEKQLESLAEGLVEQAARTGRTLPEVVAQMCADPQVKGLVTPKELLRACRKWKRDSKLRECFGEEIPVEPGAMESRGMDHGEWIMGNTPDERLRDGQAELLEVVRYLGGDLVRARPVWREAKKYTLRHGEVAEYCDEPGEGWLVCAVRVWNDRKVVRVFPEMRIKRRRRAGWNGTRGDTLELQCLTLDCEGLDREKIITRFAAVMQMHHSRSGLRNAAHVAKLTGRTRAAGAAQRAVLVKDYYKRTDGSAGFPGVSSSQRLKKKVRKAGEGKAENRRTKH